MSKSNILVVICTSVLCAILGAGLWPFHAPRDAVSWLETRNGLSFGHYGSILSSAEFKMTKSSEGPCSLEIGLRPAKTFDSNSIVAFSTTANHLQFRVAQSGDDLFIWRDLPYREHQSRIAHIAIDHAFRRGSDLLITITSGAQGTLLYLNGVLAKQSPEFWLTGKDFTGQLVIGNSPMENNSWSGQLWGLGIYKWELTGTQVSEHYHAWQTNQATASVGDQGTRALYLFNEHEGRVVHNQVAAEPDLYIPEHYFVLHQELLVPPWKEFRFNWGYVEDVIRNVVAFVPLGFFLCTYFSSVRRINRAVLACVILGGIVSFTIEALQAYLPTRNSGITDVLTNTFGTAVGATLYRCGSARALLAKAGLVAMDDVGTVPT